MDHSESTPADLNNKGAYTQLSVTRDFARKIQRPQSVQVRPLNIRQQVE